VGLKIQELIRNRGTCLNIVSGPVTVKNQLNTQGTCFENTDQAKVSALGNGVDYATRMKSYNPLFRMVANIVWYIIVHVGDFILSLLRLFSVLFFCTFIYGFRYTWGLGGNLHFFRLKYFLLFNPMLSFEFT